MHLLIDVESDQPRQWAIPYTCVFCINALIGGFFARSVLVAPTPDTQPGAATSSRQVSVNKKETIAYTLRAILADH